MTYMEIWRDRLNQYRLTLKGANHQIIATTEGYTTKASAENAARLLRQTNSLTPIYDRT